MFWGILLGIAIVFAVVIGALIAFIRGGFFRGRQSGGREQWLLKSVLINRP